MPGTHLAHTRITGTVDQVARNAVPTDGTTFIFVEHEWLAAACWCDTQIIGVPQRLIVDCLTLSCGRPECVDPISGDATEGKYVSPNFLVFDRRLDTGKTLYVDTGRHKPSEPKPRRPYLAPRRVSEPKRIERRRLNQQDRMRRRDLVEIYWKSGAKVRKIAEELEVKPSDVYNDVGWLTACGRIEPRRPGRRSRTGWRN